MCEKIHPQQFTNQISSQIRKLPNQIKYLKISSYAKSHKDLHVIPAELLRWKLIDFIDLWHKAT